MCVCASEPLNKEMHDILGFLQLIWYCCMYNYACRVAVFIMSH